MEKFKEFVNCYLNAWRNYMNFSGRASRKDYWGFELVNFLIVLLIGLVEKIVGMDDNFISSLYTVAIICPNITLCTRRLHDVGRSGWWQLAIAVPLLNLYLLYMLWIKRGTVEANKFDVTVAAAAQPANSAYTVPVNNEFSGYDMCPVAKPAQPETEAELPQLKKKCISCGAEIKIAAKFCSECGEPQE